MSQPADETNHNQEVSQQNANNNHQQENKYEDKSAPKQQSQYRPRKRSSRDSSPESEFENRLGKKHHQGDSEFKIHFYVRRVHMNGMKDNEFLQFIKRKVSLAGQCDIVQMTNQSGSVCDVAIGMSNDDNAKLVYIGKKHFNFGRSRNKENVILSDAFKNYLENRNMLDPENLERLLRRNQHSRRSESSQSSGRGYRRSRSPKRKDKSSKKADNIRRRSSRSSSSDRDIIKKRPKYSRSSSNSRDSSPIQQQDKFIPINIAPQKPPQNNDKNAVYIFAIPVEFEAQHIIQEITHTYNLAAPLYSTWHTTERMCYLELVFQDETAPLALQKTSFQVQNIPLLVIGKKQRPVQELLRNYEVQVDLDKDVDAFTMVQEFKKYGTLIGIYVFQPNRCYLLLYSSSSQLQELLRPPAQIQIHIKDTAVMANAKIIDKATDIQRPQLKETLAYQLKNASTSQDSNNDDHYNKQRRSKGDKNNNKKK